MAPIEEQMAELDEVVARLEHGDLPLEESVQLYERGMALTLACRRELESAEGRLLKVAADMDGDVVPIEAADLADPGDV